MRYRFLLLICSGMLMLSGCGPESPRAATIEVLRGDPDRGHALFAANCASCHQSAGFTKMLDWYPRRAFLSTVVIGGKTMPSFHQLSDQDIADIYAGLRTPAP